MKNSEFKIGSHITVYGNKGIVENITKCKEYECSYNNKKIDTSVYTEEAVEAMRKKGYILIETGRTATYFTVDFESEKQLKNTAYDHGCYGCIDEYENYGTWD